MNREQWGRLCVRLATILIISGVLILLPDPYTNDFIRAKNALVVLIGLICMGKALFDSFFYERHP